MGKEREFQIGDLVIVTENGPTTETMFKVGWIGKVVNESLEGGKKVYAVEFPESSVRWWICPEAKKDVANFGRIALWFGEGQEDYGALKEGDVVQIIEVNDRSEKFFKVGDLAVLKESSNKFKWRADFKINGEGKYRKSIGGSGTWTINPKAKESDFARFVRVGGMGGRERIPGDREWQAGDLVEIIEVGEESEEFYRVGDRARLVRRSGRDDQKNRWLANFTGEGGRGGKSPSHFGGRKWWIDPDEGKEGANFARWKLVEGIEEEGREANETGETKETEYIPEGQDFEAVLADCLDHAGEIGDVVIQAVFIEAVRQAMQAVEKQKRRKENETDNG